MISAGGIFKKKHFIIILAAVICILASGFFLLFDDIIIYSVRRVSGYDLSFSVWEKSLTGTNYLHDLKILIPEQNVSVAASRGDVNFDIERYLKKREISADFLLEDVVLRKIEISQGDTDDTSLYDLFLGEGQKFNSLSSDIFFDGNTFSISDLYADSSDIKVSGNCEFSDGWNTADIDIKISISPVLARTMSKDIRDNVLFEEDNGWYTTIISYKGNSVLLKALYNFSEKK